MRTHLLEIVQMGIISLKERVNLSRPSMYAQNSLGSMCPRINRIYLQQLNVVAGIYICLKLPD